MYGDSPQKLGLSPSEGSRKKRWLPGALHWTRVLHSIGDLILPPLCNLSQRSYIMACQANTWKYIKTCDIHSSQTRLFIKLNTQGTNSQNTVYLPHQKSHLLSDIGEYVDVAELCYKLSICSAVHQYSICIRHMSPQSPGRWWMIHFKQSGWYYMTVTFLSLLFDSKINEEKWARNGIWLKVSF